MDKKMDEEPPQKTPPPRAQLTQLETANNLIASRDRSRKQKGFVDTAFEAELVKTAVMTFDEADRIIDADKVDKAAAAAAAKTKRPRGP